MFCYVSLSLNVYKFVNYYLFLELRFNMKDVCSKNHPPLLQIGARDSFEIKKESLSYHSLCKENLKKVYDVLKPGYIYFKWNI